MTSIGKENRNNQCLYLIKNSKGEEEEEEEEKKKKKKGRGREGGGGRGAEALSQAVEGLDGVLWVYKIGLK